MQGATSQLNFSWWLEHWGEPLAIFGAALMAALFIRGLVLRALQASTTNHRTAIAVMKDTLRWPSLLWCYTTAIYVALEFAQLTPGQERWASDIVYIFLVLSFSLVISSIFWRISSLYSEQRGIAAASSGLTRVLIHLVVQGIGLTLILRHFDVSIAPLLTALGVG